MIVGPHYLNPETQARLMAVSQENREKLAARRAARVFPAAEMRHLERRSGVADRRQGERRSVDRRGAITVTIDGATIIRPRKDLARFDAVPAVPSAFGSFA